jgi:hypothetical protein
MYEVHVFTGTATATGECYGPFHPGDRHPLLAFLRQGKGTDHDWAGAESWISKAGWREVIFERAGMLEAERMTGQSEYLVNAFEKAIHEEFGFVVYDKPLEREEEE